MKQKDHLPSGGSTPEIYKEELTRIAKGAGITFVGKILGGGIQYLYVIVAARVLGGETFGLYSLALTIISFAGIIGLLGLDNGVIRYVAFYQAAGDKGRVKGAIVKSMQYSFIPSVIIGILLFLTAEVIFAKIFDKPGLENVIKIMALSLPFWSLMIIALSATKGFLIMRYSVYGRDLFWPLSNLILVLMFFFVGLRLHGVVVAYVISTFLTFILALLFLKKTFPDIKDTRIVPETRKLLRVSVPLLLITCLNFLVMWTDTLMLGYFRSSEEVGIYNAALKTAILTSMILASFNAIFAPVISDLHSKREMQKLGSLFKTITKWIYTISFPIFLLMALLSKEIMTIFGPEFAAGWLSLIVLAFAQLVNAGVGSVGFMLVMTGWQDFVMYGTMGVCFLNILLNYLLVPAYGIVGAASASGISIILLNVFWLLGVYYFLKIHPYSMKFIRITILAISAFSALVVLRIVFVHLVGMQKVLASILIFVFVYSWLIYKWGIDDDDRIIVGFLKGKFLKT